MYIVGKKATLTGGLLAEFTEIQGRTQTVGFHICSRQILADSSRTI